jgi:hypothetical protein
VCAWFIGKAKKTAAADSTKILNDDDDCDGGKKWLPRGTKVNAHKMGYRPKDEQKV